MTLSFNPDYPLLLLGVLLGYLIYGVLNLLIGTVCYGQIRSKTYGYGEILIGIFYLVWFCVVVIL